MPTRVIPNYALYGDQAQPGWQSWFDFEWIPTRSRPYNWKIRPHKHDAFIQILCLTQGGGDVLIDNARYVLAAPCLILIPAQTVHGFQFSEDVNGPVVTAAQRPLESLANAVMPELLHTLRQPGVIPLQKEGRELDGLMPLFLALERETLVHEIGQTAAGMSLLTALFIQVARLSGASATLSGAPPERSPHGVSHRVSHLHTRPPSRKTQRVEKFRALVDENYKKHKPITAYADQLGITPGQLSRLCREVLGVSSLDVINTRLVHEAQRELVYTSSSIKQVADALGFADETYFGRFFRKHTAMSPREFRTKTVDGMLLAPGLPAI